jgi:hypothetical protein
MATRIEWRLTLHNEGEEVTFHPKILTTHKALESYAETLRHVAGMAEALAWEFLNDAVNVNAHLEVTMTSSQDPVPQPAAQTGAQQQEEREVGDEAGDDVPASDTGLGSEVDEDQPVEVVADTHEIMVSGPAVLLQLLVQAGALELDQDEDDLDEDDLDEDDDEDDLDEDDLDEADLDEDDLASQANDNALKAWERFKARLAAAIRGAPQEVQEAIVREIPAWALEVEELLEAEGRDENPDGEAADEDGALELDEDDDEEDLDEADLDADQDEAEAAGD